MVTKMKARDPAPKPAPKAETKTASKATMAAKKSPPRPRRKAGEEAAGALSSGRAAVQAIRDTAVHASGAAMAVAADLTELVAEASHNTLAVNPLIGISRADVGAAARSLLKAVRRTPGKALTHYGAYLKELAAVAKGKSALAPDPKDRRFADPAWKNNALYTRLMQAYLATQKELGSYIQTSKLDTVEKGRAQFFASLVTDALAPSNWVLGNPAAVRKIVDTGGDNLVQGLKNLVHDVRHNNMLPSMVDATPFKVGQNMATSPGQVVYRHEMFELLQFTPSTAQVHKRPLVMSPPQVNKYYAVDLTPDKSLIKWTVDSGVQMFVVSWRNPTVEHRHWGLEDYVMALDQAVDVARQITGSPDVNMWGSCSGGMTLAAYLGWLAAKGDNKVVNTTLAVCVLNSEAALEDSTLGLFSSPAAIRAAKARSRRKGFVSGEEMATMFAWLRPNDLIWNYWVNNYLLGNKPPAYDILAWNIDATRLPGQFHCDLLDLVAKNPYMNPGTLEIEGLPIDMSKLKVGAYVIAGITDHITPWKACYGTARLLGPETTFILANAGHLQSMINPPGVPKSFFFAAPANEADPMTWAQLAQPTRQEGSWWPHWRPWIQARSGELVDAPSKLGSRKHKPLCPAPGTYIFEP
ncbi:MAG: alpha/beta fold hydrolase [Gammaproteobacteria bacterium]|nr:alpha/beta fold hydrolase [Gammaproteobacteria bacterium]